MAPCLSFVIQGGDETSVRWERELGSTIQALLMKQSELYSNISAVLQYTYMHIWH